MDTVITAVVSLVGVLAVGVLVPVWLVNRAERIRREDNARADQMHREDREAEWKRQDSIAARAAEAAAATARRADEAAHLLLSKQEENMLAQQQVATSAAEQAAQVAVKAAEAARLLASNNELVAETAKETGKKLDTIHTLVNSNMTAAMQAEFDAVTRELAMMREVVELRRAAGQAPSPEALAAIERTQAKLHELDASLADRAKAQERVNRQIGLDITTTTHYRRQDEDALSAAPKTAGEQSEESPDVEPPDVEPQQVSDYRDSSPPGHEEGGG